MENAWQFLKRFHIKLPYDPAIPLLGVFPGEMNCVFTQKLVHFAYEQLLLPLADRWSRPKCPSADAGVNKLQYIHKVECYLAIKRNEILIHDNVDKP